MSTYQSEFEVRLPIGYADPSGRVIRQAVLRKMRGHEEALPYDADLVAGRLVTELIASCLVRLGDLAPVTADLVRRLYSADRNYLLLELRRVTLGDRLQASYACPRCRAAVAVREDLSALPVSWLEEGQALEDIHLELHDGYVDRQGERHTRLVLTLPTGADEEFVLPMVLKDPLKAQDALLLRCIKQFGVLSTNALEAYGVKILRDLTLGDRLRLQACFNSMTPGVDFLRRVACGACATEFEGVLDVSSFFVLG
ncbi:MAG: hypothetical protein WAU91_22560 [Desulfatitalea sp.]